MSNVITEQKARPPEFRYLNSAKPIASMGEDIPSLSRPENDLVKRLTEKGFFNPATVQNCSTRIIARAEDCNGVNRLVHFSASDGLHIDGLVGIALDSPYEAGTALHVGREDPRGYYDDITGKVYLSFVDNPGHTQTNSLAVSTDFAHFTDLGHVFDDGVPDKDGAIMGRRYDKLPVYVRRKMEGDIWGMTVAVGKTEDIEGKYEEVFTYYPTRDWEGTRIGASQFIELKGMGKNGGSWYLGMHHGAGMPGKYWVYPSGLDLFDEKGNIMAVAATPQIWPRTEYEKRGFEDKQVSLCTGLELVVRGGVQYVRAYFGAGDRHIMVAEARLDECIYYMLSPQCRVGKPEKKIIQLGDLSRLKVALGDAA
jgi:predicted GH43/DUF377 family glycosyl hydrolase